MKYIILGILAVVCVISVIWLTFDDILHGKERIETECKQDCEDTGQEYYKVHFGEARRNSCICLDKNGEVNMMW